MQRVFRSLLILLILLTPSGNVGAAPGVAPMVICGAAGAETIWLDAAGNPAKAPGECIGCPDCLAMVAASVPAPATIPLPTAFQDAVALPAAEFRPLARAKPAPLPRGPPAASAMVEPAECGRANRHACAAIPHAGSAEKSA